MAIGGGQGAPGIGVQAPQVEWKGLVNTLNLQPWELAYCMIHGTEEVTVLEALATSQYALVYIATQDEAAIKRQVTGAATMPLVNHYLTVVAGLDRHCDIGGNWGWKRDSGVSGRSGGGPSKSGHQLSGHATCTFKIGSVIHAWCPIEGSGPSWESNPGYGTNGGLRQLRRIDKLHSGGSF